MCALWSRCVSIGAWLPPLWRRPDGAGGLPARGTLYTWTTQEFLPKLPYLGPETPQTFEPWAVGYVELDGQLRVEGRLYDVDPKELRFGMEFDVVVRLFRITEDGTEVYTYGFAPAAGTAVS